MEISMMDSPSGENLKPKCQTSACRAVARRSRSLEGVEEGRQFTLPPFPHTPTSPHPTPSPARAVRKPFWGCLLFIRLVPWRLPSLQKGWGLAFFLHGSTLKFPQSLKSWCFASWPLTGTEWSSEGHWLTSHLRCAGSQVKDAQISKQPWDGLQNFWSPSSRKARTRPCHCLFPVPPLGRQLIGLANSQFWNFTSQNHESKMDSTQQSSKPPKPIVGQVSLFLCHSSFKFGFCHA